jgi:hypothetical protein
MDHLFLFTVPVLIEIFNRPRSRKTFDSISQDPSLCGRLVLVFLSTKVRRFISQSGTQAADLESNIELINMDHR